jgi:inosine-uridine nucleoside N-ribohydrolase
VDVLIDTDPGIDDALALILALRSPELDVKGITVVHGNVSVDQGTANALKVLELVGRTDVPVASGAPAPLLRPARDARIVHGEDGLGGALPGPPIGTPVDEYGPAFLTRTVESAARPITVITLGPLTNLAIALLASPHLRERIERLYVMGGAVRSEGNTIPGAEYNIHCDPEAAAIVLRGGVPTTLIGLNVTMRCVFPRELSERLRDADDPVQQFVGRATSPVAELYQRYYGLEGCAMHDPLTVAAAVDPAVIRGKEVWVDVETKGDLTAGQTVVDFWGIPTPWGEPNALVALEVDPDRFFDLFYPRVLGERPAPG